ncbi:MAG: hypothetical protein GY757_19885, partial [bacterium]|nr:hypothetical protein [bacterium]
MKPGKSKRHLQSTTPGLMGWVFFLAAILYAILINYHITLKLYLPVATIWAIVTYFVYRSLGLAFDFFVMIFLIFALYGGVRSNGIFLLYLPLITGVVLCVAHKINSRTSLFLAWAAPLTWFVISNDTAIKDFGILHYLLLLSAILMVLVFTMIFFYNPGKPLKKIDFLLCSYSGNTAHFSEQFTAGAEEAGAEVNMHRFHYYKSFKPAKPAVVTVKPDVDEPVKPGVAESVFDGDALVIAFPVFGGKPPWPFLNYLLFRLPRAKGKPAFILYTCIGGAENAGILCWLILTLKGYRVVGRNV